jgi:predicted Zn-dependent protease
LFRRTFLFLAGALAALGLVCAPPVQAQQQRISFIRDAEVERTIRAYAAPVLKAAGLDPDAIRVHLVNDRSLNAFVANGLNMFINTGLLIRSEHAGQVIGVMAHETGHIAGGHLARLREGLANATTEAILAMVLGAAAAVASGNPEAGAAVMMGGSHVAERGLLAYTRDMERQADQAAINFLERSGTSPRGLMEFMEILSDQELLAVGRQDPYVRTHPISHDRVEFLRDALTKVKHANAPLPRRFDEMHRRMRAKLMGYLDPTRALQVYKEDDGSLESRYARAIAFSRRPDYPKALALMDTLIAERPNDAYFQEAKAQMLFESGRPGEALPLYEKALQLQPDEPLLRIELARVQMELGAPDQVRAAIKNLETARLQEPAGAEVWRLLAIAYGRDGQLGMASLAQAERALIQRRRAEARSFAERAERQFDRGSPPWLRAQDLKRAAERLKDEQR